jgi:hypothetical protein
MPGLCEVLPTPAVLSQFHTCLAAVRRVDFFQRTGVSAPLVARNIPKEGTLLHEDDRGLQRAVGFAQDALEKGLLVRFNGLLDVVAGIGEAALGAAWGPARDLYLPTRIDPEAEIDHALL